ELAVRTMAKICVEAESTIDYGDVFKRIMQHSPVPMSPLESLASSAVRTAFSARAALILVLTRGGTTAKLVAKYRPGTPILSVVVPELTTDAFDWSCSDESPARHSLIFRGLIPVLSAASARASHEETTEDAIEFALQCAKGKGLCVNGDSVVVLHHNEASIEDSDVFDSGQSLSTRGQLSRQAPIFDEDLAVEGIPNTFEDIHPFDLFEQLFVSLLGLGFAIAEPLLSSNKDFSKLFYDCKDYIVTTCQSTKWSENVDDLVQVVGTFGFDMAKSFTFKTSYLFVNILSNVNIRSLYESKAGLI
ncbi:pyruvate kinase, partial [Trifolium pratense]